ncbi:protein CHUP1, chloroplastic-like [Neltuma alba]|uniref:protein CHUP1, chloroplastic-like n=1 Tax=Neltuma alba TaxID=207710 RepID=UPI0010A2B8BA|nr:protein CHUP1, chloroplastic-like [Prosopis alba]
MNVARVYPNLTHRRQSSTDLFTELDHMRSLLQESKERELKLQAELSKCKTNQKELEEEKTKLAEQLAALTTCVSERHEEQEVKGKHKDCTQNLELEVVELRRLNKELQMQKRNLTCRLSSLESQMPCLAKSSESDIVAKVKAEASLLRLTNEDLCKQVEGLQMSRLSEVEELAYLRWVNSCLRNELKNSSCSTPDSVNKPSSSPRSFENNVNSFDSIKKPKKWPISSDHLSQIEECPNSHIGRSPKRRHSISGSSNCSEEDTVLSKRRQSDYFLCTKEMQKQSDLEIVQRPQCFRNFQEANKLLVSSDVEKRALRIPNPPPRPSSYCISSISKQENTSQVPPPPPPLPPPPPPPNFTQRSSNTGGMVKRAPQVVELYHSLMKRDSRKDSSNGGLSDAADVADIRSSMIGEIENRSSHLLAIKADVETQGEFVKSLIREVNNAVYQNIEDVVAFVKWLDDELGFLVDERAVLKHFDWPEKKADTLREAAFGYRDLKRLETEVSSYKDDPRLPCDIALKKMVALSEKMERTVYNLLRTRDSLMRNCKQFQIPIEWMLDNEIIGKIKLVSVKLAKKYMKRVAMELQAKASTEKDPAMDYMLLQGVRFAFRIHQFAGGFDAETMHAFEELRNLACLLNKA